MTQILDRPTTEVDARAATEVRPRPIGLDREVRQAPPVGKPPGRIRWLGWLLGLAAAAAIVWLVIAEVTTEDTPAASPSYDFVGGVTADPKVRTPVVTPEMVTMSIRTGIPGDATLTQIVTFGHSPGRSLEDATVNPHIFWAIPPTYATDMEEATVWPPIYESAAAVGSNASVQQSSLPGVFWRQGELIDEMTFGVYPPVAAPASDTVTSDFDGIYWRYDLVLEERPMFPTDLDLTFGIWPAMYSQPVVVSGVQVPPSVPLGGHMNILM